MNTQFRNVLVANAITLAARGSADCWVALSATVNGCVTARNRNVNEQILTYPTPASITSGYFVNILSIYSGKKNPATKKSRLTPAAADSAKPVVFLMFLKSITP